MGDWQQKQCSVSKDIGYRDPDKERIILYCASRVGALIPKAIYRGALKNRC